MRLEIDTEAYLRLLVKRDAERIFQLVEQNRSYLSEWLPWVPSTKAVEDTQGFLEIVEANHTSKKAVHCGIIVQDQLVGLIGLRFSEGDYVANIGYWLSEHVSGQGLMTRSVQQLCRYGFDQLHLERIEIRAATSNPSSWSIAERLGFTREGILRRCERVSNGFFDHYMYSLIRTDDVDWR